MSHRLQGKDFAQMRPLLKMVCYEQSTCGRIRAYLVHKKSGKKFHHWLNPDEQERFELVKDNYLTYNQFMELKNAKRMENKKLKESKIDEH